MLSAGQTGAPVEFTPEGGGRRQRHLHHQPGRWRHPAELHPRRRHLRWIEPGPGRLLHHPGPFQPQLPLGAKAGSLSATTSAGRTTSVALAGTSGGPLQFSPAPHNFGSLATGNSSHRGLHADQQRGQRHQRSVGRAGHHQRGSRPSPRARLRPDAGAVNMTDDTDICVVKVRFLASATAGPKTATLNATGSYTGRRHRRRPPPPRRPSRPT